VDLLRPLLESGLLEKIGGKKPEDIALKSLERS